MFVLDWNDEWIGMIGNEMKYNNIWILDRY